MESSAGWKESDFEGLLRSLDDTMLPDVETDAGSLNYSVVHGEVWGQFEATAEREIFTPKKACR